MTNQITQSHWTMLVVALALAPATGFAYVGPGAGITMLGSLWGLIVAVVFIVFGLLILPFKIMRNRRMKKKADAASDDKDVQKDPPAASPERQTEAD